MTSQKTISHNGVNYVIPFNSISRSVDRFEEAMFKYYIDNGVMPTRAQMKSESFKVLYGVNFSDNIYDKLSTDNRRDTVTRMINYITSDEGKASLLQHNPNINLDPKTGLPNLSGQATVGTQQTPVEQNIQSMYDQIYQSFYDRAGVQYQQGIQNLGREQQQAGIANASERQKMLDSIRNYRRSALKSGLSSAQISANELQNTLISQDLMNQNQRQLSQQRSALEQEFAMRGPNASLETWNMMNTGNLPSVFGQSYAAQIADPMYQSIWLKNNPQYIEPYKTITKTD